VAGVIFARRADAYQPLVCLCCMACRPSAIPCYRQPCPPTAAVAASRCLRFWRRHAELRCGRDGLRWTRAGLRRNGQLAGCRRRFLCACWRPPASPARHKTSPALRRRAWRGSPGRLLTRSCLLSTRADAGAGGTGAAAQILQGGKEEGRDYTVFCLQHRACRSCSGAARAAGRAHERARQQALLPWLCRRATARATNFTQGRRRFDAALRLEGRAAASGAIRWLLSAAAAPSPYLHLLPLCIHYLPAALPVHLKTHLR